MAGDERGVAFDEFARARVLWLRRVAYLLANDWHAADDLVQTTLTKLYTKWHRVGGLDNVDGYARTTLVNTFLAERRSPWSRVLLRRSEPEATGRQSDVEAAVDLREAIAALPPRQRATVVLRYYCDLSVEQTAEALGCSAGNVKSQTSRALSALRSALEPCADSEPIGGRPR